MKTCKRFGALLLALILALSLSVTAYAAVEDTGFSDVAADAWYADAVTYVRDNGLMSGTSDTTFTPGGTMTRGMLVTTLYRMAGQPDLSDENLGYPFADVVADSWYGDAVYWARLNGVANGTSDSTFSPDGTLTREQAVTMLYNYANAQGYDTTQGGMAAQEYPDFASVSSWASEAVTWAVNTGVLTGTNAGTLNPQGSATRAELATMLVRFTAGLEG